MTSTPSSPPLDALVLVKVRMEGDCWMWQGARQSNGYGYFVRRKGLKGGQKKTYVHRHAYEAFNGPIPEDHEVHHSCFNRACLNPEHLFAKTHLANCAPELRAVNRDRRIT